MKFLKTGLSLVLLGAGLAATPGLQASAAAPPAPAPAAAGDSLVQRMRGEATGTVRISRESSTGKVGFVRTGQGGDLLPSVRGASPAAAATKASAYLTEFAPAFGATRAQLKQQSVQADPYGWTVTYTQAYQGLPVFGAMLRAHVDRDGSLTGVNGFTAPGLDLSVTPRRTPAAAASRAIAFVKSSPAEAATGQAVRTRTLKATSNVLSVYRVGAIKGDSGVNTLAYVVEVTDGAAVRDKVFVDANTGKVLNRYSMVDNALDRELREAAGTPSAPTFTTVWREGDEFPGALNEDQQNLVNSSGESYWFFKNAFNRDSYDGNGAKRITVNNDPRISCPNANWNGQTTNYCDGVTSDDVVAHEWGHAYTEYTWGGIYQWQSGALNEAYSDIWGETLDLINGREDEGEGDINAKRPVGLCSSHSPSLPLVSINTPLAIAKDCLTGGASYGPQLDGTGITSDVVVGLDEANPAGTTTTDGCTAYTNAADVAGKIAMVDRGTCSFTDKTLEAQAAGAIAVIIGNRDDSIISPSGAGPEFTIPTVTIGLADRESIRTALTNGDTVNVTLKDAGGDRFDSYRWLIGEKSPAFGGAIRDMWNPTCYGDPGKVTDVEYKCSTDDQGGVHGNSGVPNHGYALLVDGGTYNGQTVTGIGLNKAAAIYFRAMTDYMTPVSDFADHADALDSACADLTGKSIKVLSTSPNDASTYDRKITNNDCDQVAAMAAAVELRTPATQCDFQPQLDPNTPNLCGPGTETETAFSEDFETGIGAWTLDGQSVYGGPTRDWVTSTDLPDGNLPAGDQTAAFGPAPDLGTCTSDSADFSSVNTMTSPDIELTAGGLSPRLSFDHNVQTELGFDGGNLQIAVNGGDFAPVPAAAYSFNPPTVLATEAAGNTNPLAGQPGFTGTDGGRIQSDWGTSQVDLEAAGVNAGDTIKVRFAIGRDGCGGVKGWWVDNVNVVLCQAASDVSVTATHLPEPSTFGSASELQVDVASTIDDGVPTGDISVTLDGTEVAAGPLVDGSVTLPLPTDLPAGSPRLFVAYSGDATYDAVTRSKVITINAAATTVQATRDPATTTQGDPSTLDVTVAAPDGVVEVPTGDVSVSTAGGDEIATGTLDETGFVTVDLPGDLPVGTNTLTVDYLGDGSFAPSATTVDAPVTAAPKAASKTTAVASPAIVKKGKGFSAKVTVTADGTVPTGTVGIFFAGQKIGTGTLSGGKVTIKITKKFAQVGTKTLTARYGGSATVLPSADTFTVKIIRAKR